MKPGYYILLNDYPLHGPIACDNHKSPYGYQDRRIKRKLLAWRKKMLKHDDVSYCEIIKIGDNAQESLNTEPL